MSLHACSRHPAAAALRGHCAACLIEAAFTASEDATATTAGTFEIQVPLGGSDAASVFLVRGESAGGRLLRLKRWRTPAPAGFTDAFERLQVQLAEWRPPAIAVPVAAWVDAAGRPSVLTEFRQGMPLLESVRSGWLHPARAAAALRELRNTLDTAHARGLAHGSIVPGNVFSARPDGAPYLLDFGLAPLLSGSATGCDWPATDIDGFTRMQADLEGLTSRWR